jgi:hypothetical protein
MAWVTLTRRTHDPKLAYIEAWLDELQVPHRRTGSSADGPILEVQDRDFERASHEILSRPDHNYGTFANRPDDALMFDHEMYEYSEHYRKNWPQITKQTDQPLRQRTISTLRDVGRALLGLAALCGGILALIAFGVVMRSLHIEQFVGGAAAASLWIGIFAYGQSQYPPETRWQPRVWIPVATFATLITAFWVWIFPSLPSADWPALECC